MIERGCGRFFQSTNPCLRNNEGKNICLDRCGFGPALFSGVTTKVIVVYQNHISSFRLDIHFQFILSLKVFPNEPEVAYGENPVRHWWYDKISAPGTKNPGTQFILNLVYAFEA